MQFYIKKTRNDYYKDKFGNTLCPVPTKAVKCKRVKGVLLRDWSCEINTLEELKAIADESGYELVVSFEKEDNMDGFIEIYNTYRE